ncbi:predicted protein [Nematostella vectensis]|uniref:Uncharacterized protein n=1 Tax=Nematostella vectensis TaxID=45351 RepID=A7S902_NEMVE|nr:predicted protein [Nematostella vectensis]|eukprot:XP_001631911.1 predicted protein [Nematostella vectensis]
MVGYLFFTIVWLCCLTGLDSCSTDNECSAFEHCCKGNCTAKRIHCWHVCSTDHECNQESRCVLGICVNCSSAFPCLKKTCLNDTHCPNEHSCTNNRCEKVQKLGLSGEMAPFVIFIAALAVSLLIICYNDYILERVGHRGLLNYLRNLDCNCRLTLWFWIWRLQRARNSDSCQSEIGVNFNSRPQLVTNEKSDTRTCLSLSWLSHFSRWLPRCCQNRTNVHVLVYERGSLELRTEVPDSNIEIPVLLLNESNNSTHDTHEQPCGSMKSCRKTSECLEGYYCCKSHCTPKEIRCNDLCNRDEDCARDELCVQHMCMACSKRLSCDVKTCFNNTNCPESYSCKEGKCTKIEARALVSFLPFVVIIGVLGFALMILCYTEGCWKELMQYLKRRYSNYGSLAREEWEAEEQENLEARQPGGVPRSHRQSRRKTRGREEGLGSSTSCATSTCEHSNLQIRNNDSTDSQGSLITSHSVTFDQRNNSVSTVSLTLSENSRRGLRSVFLREVTSPNSICQRNPNPFSTTSDMMNSGRESHAGSTESLPTYNSLFEEVNELNEPPPPSYEDVVGSNSHVTNVTPAACTIVRITDANNQDTNMAETVV